MLIPRFSSRWTESGDFCFFNLAGVCKRILDIVEDWLTLRKAQINLVIQSIYTIFARAIAYDSDIPTGSSPRVEVVI